MSLVRIKIMPGKPSETKAEGVPGGRCLDAMRPYNRALGGKEISNTPTAEMELPDVQIDQDIDIRPSGL